MTKNQRKKLLVMAIAVSLTFILRAKAAFSRNEAAQGTLTPYAYLPIVFNPAPFVKTEHSPFYLQNFANNAGCNWMGMAGEVLDFDRNPVSAGSYVVHIWGSGIDSHVTVGTEPAYSPSGWEQFLFDWPVVRDYEIQLEIVGGTAVSPIYAVQTSASCNENLVRFDFVQNQ